MGHLVSRLSQSSTELLSSLNPTPRSHMIVVKQTPGSAAVAGFVERNNFTLEYFVSNGNPQTCTVAELLESVNMYRTTHIQSLKAADGRALDPHASLKGGSTVWV